MSTLHALPRHPMHIGRCQKYFCCDDKEASTQKVLGWLQTERVLTRPV